MRDALQRILVPFLKIEGLTGKFPNFQREENGQLHLLSVQFDKYGGGLCLEFANHPPGDSEIPWGEVVSQEKITVGHTALDERVRLQENSSKNSTREDWFRFDQLKEGQYEDLANHIVHLFPQVNQWVRGKQIGINLFSNQS